MKMRHCGSRNIILIWNIYLTILIPFVVLLSGIWHITSFMIRQTLRLFIIVRCSQCYCVAVERNSKRIQTIRGAYFEISARSMAGSMFGEL